jgi:hypothetical protein
MAPFTARKTKIKVSWDAKPCILVEKYPKIGCHVKAGLDLLYLLTPRSGILLEKLTSLCS